MSGLTSTPKELSAKHRSNRGTGPAKAGAEVVATAAASPAIQKIRDYQLQVLFVVCAPPEPRHDKSMAAAFMPFKVLVELFFFFGLYLTFNSVQ